MDSDSADLLYGLPAVAKFLHLKPAQARHLVARGTLPTFRIGKLVCSRKTTLNAWLAEREAASAKR